MIVKLIDAPMIPGGKALALCEDSGEVVAKQVGCVISNHVDERSTITVTFLIDGETIRFEGADG